MTLLRGRMTLSQRFTAVFALVILSVVGLLAVLGESYLRRTLQQQTEARARSLALSLAAVARPYLLDQKPGVLQNIADATMADPDLAYLVILDREGRVAGYSGRPEMQGKRLTDLANLRALNAESPGAEAVLLRDARGRAVSVIECQVPVRLETGDGARGGTVRVGLSLEPVRQRMVIARLILLFTAACGFLAAVFTSNLLARRVARPLARLVDAATALERGVWDPAFSVRTGDEIEELTVRFARAAESLDRQKKELLAAKEALTSLNTSLEAKVQRRTAELTASREKYRLLVEGSPDAFVLLERDQVKFANSAFFDIFQYPPEALEDLRWTHVIHPDFHRLARDQFRCAEETLGDFRAELMGVTRSGTPVELEVRGRGVRFRAGTAVELVLSDVGDKRRLLRQVVQSERLRAMGEMTAMVAHAFNNLLAVILGRTQLLVRRTEEERVRENLYVIQATAQRAGTMVRQLQEYFGEQVDLRFSDVDLNAVLKEAAMYLDTLWRTTREPSAGVITVKLDLRPIPPVRGAEPLLQDVFRRLLINAAEAMPLGGEIRVHTEASGRSVTARVEDDGTGMSPEVQRRAFEPFFTTRGSRTRGLGLSASFGIVQQHEGRMEIHSEEGRGTRVEVILPVHSAQERVVPFPAADAAVDSAADARPSAAA
jgi:two-component system sensor histidine kinase AtoS